MFGDSNRVKAETAHQSLYDPRDVRAFPGSEVSSQPHGGRAVVWRPDLAQGPPEDKLEEGELGTMYGDAQVRGKINFL